MIKHTYYEHENDKLQNQYYQQNQIMFNRLLDIVNHTKKIKLILNRSYNSDLKSWIVSSTQILDGNYDILTRAYWIIHNIIDWNDCRVICPQCKKPFKNKDIYRFHLGYSNRCSVKCMNQSSSHIDNVRRTYKKHKAEDSNFVNNIIQKTRATNVKNGHSPTWVNQDKCKDTKLKNHNNPTYNNIEKAKDTRYRKNNGKWHSDDYVQKTQQTCLINNGYKCALSYDGKRNEFDQEAIRDKALQTMRKNFTFNKSKQEDEAYSILCNQFGKDNIIRQYKSDKYPFQCDFYVTTFDIYIEYNGSWTHGRHAYNANSTEDQKFLNHWKEKCKLNSYKKHNYYQRAIYVWTQLDVKKRTIAKQNNLKFVEVWTINELLQWLSSLKDNGLVR